MEFDYTEDQRMMRAAIEDLMEEFDRAYWRERDRRCEFPVEFWERAAEAGWTGTTIPEEYGGDGASLADAAVVLETIAEHDAGLVPISTLSTHVFVGEILAEYGSDELKERWLPAMAGGRPPRRSR